MRFLLIFVFLLLPFWSWEQVDIEGSWWGVVTQNEGGFRSEYQFEIYFIQKGNKLEGRSYVYFDNAYAQMELQGFFLDKNTVLFQEIKVVDFTVLDGLEWCIKRGQLKLNTAKETWELNGDWAGATSFGPCIPGRVHLKKVKPRA